MKQPRPNWRLEIRVIKHQHFKHLLFGGSEDTKIGSVFGVFKVFVDFLSETGFDEHIFCCQLRWNHHLKTTWNMSSFPPPARVEFLNFGGWICWCFLFTCWSRWWQLKDFLFSPLLGEMIQFDWYFSNGLKPPTSDGFVLTVTKKKRPASVMFFFWSLNAICSPVELAGDSDGLRKHPAGSRKRCTWKCCHQMLGLTYQLCPSIKSTSMPVSGSGGWVGKI